MSLFKEWKPPKIEHLKPTKWGWMVSYPERLLLGKNTDIGAFTYIQAQEKVFIGENVQIGGGCKIYSVDTIGGNKGTVYIDEGAKIGANCVIMPHVYIGVGTLVGALSFVKSGTITGDNELWVGIPATLKRKII